MACAANSKRSSPRSKCAETLSISSSSISLFISLILAALLISGEIEGVTGICAGIGGCNDVEFFLEGGFENNNDLSASILWLEIFVEFDGLLLSVVKSLVEETMSGLETIYI